MTDNFLHTAKRMQKSSESLHNNGDYHNACYLGGYVVECYTKIIVDQYSFSFGTNKSGRNFSHRINDLNTEMQHILSGDSSLSCYILDGNRDFSNIITSWKPGNLRYVDSSGEIASKNTSDDFQREINLAMQRLAAMLIDGIIR